MPNCEGACPREQASLGPPSPGPVLDAEVLCRAAYDPLHIKKGAVQKALIRRSDLVADELSVWRLSAFSQDELQSLSLKIPTPANNALDRILGVKAADVRAIRGATKDERAFSILEDRKSVV